ncbi:MAG: hypothetical protein ABI896_09895 [Actinomycetota bacterium]
MKSRILIVAALAMLVVPAMSFAGSPNGADRANGARACRALKASMGDALFAQTYGTAQSNRKNAFGRCVSQWAHSEQQGRVSARSACSAEKADPTFADSHDGKTFDQFYGTGNGANAFGKCVSSKAKAASTEARQNTTNAAKQCKTERTELGLAEFRAKYGKSGHDRNAFGKCVAQLAKAPSA